MVFSNLTELASVLVPDIQSVLADFYPQGPYMMPENEICRFMVMVWVLS